jgi:hypothetical protein
MSTMSNNPQPTEGVLGPRKCRAPLHTDGEPVTTPAIKKRKSALKPGPQKKPTQKQGPVKPVPAKKTQSQVPSVHDDLDEDDLIRSEQPHNPRNILEASDGSDDDDNDAPPPAIDVDGDSGDEGDVVEVVEKPEEDDEAELGANLLSITDD